MTEEHKILTAAAIKIIIRGSMDDILETRRLKFTIRNINKIAGDYDASILKIDVDTCHAVLKDNRERLIFCDRS